MADRFTVRHGGTSYDVTRRASREATPAAETVGGDVWEVTRTGAPITSFPAGDGDSAESVRRKVVEWLEASADRPDQEIGRN